MEVRALGNREVCPRSSQLIFVIQGWCDHGVQGGVLGTREVCPLLFPARIHEFREGVIMGCTGGALGNREICPRSCLLIFVISGVV